MTEVTVALINRLPETYLMVLVPVVLVAGVWVFTHLRRDKHGKFYFYSQKYEDAKRNRKQDEALRMLTESRKDILQLQICANDDFPPTAKRLAYWEYKKLGHNSWVDNYVVEHGLFTRGDLAYVSANKEDV